MARIQYTEELYKKDLHDPDNHNGEVKWALENITTNKANGCDEITVDLFQILKDDAVKVLHSIGMLSARVDVMASKVPIVSCMLWVCFHTYIGCDVISQVGLITQIH